MSSPTLVLACRDGDLNLCQTIIANGAADHLNANNDAPKHTPLTAASLNGHRAVCHLLIENGADVNVKNKPDQQTPLMCAAERSHLDVCMLLLDHQARINEQDVDGFTALALAVSQGRVDLRPSPAEQANLSTERVEELLTIPDMDESKVVQVCQLLVSHGADIDLPGEDGCTPLGIAAIDNRMTLAKFLLDNGADPNALMEEGVTPLHQAIKGGHLEMCQLLLNHQASITAGFQIHHQPILALTAFFGKCEIADLLIQHGASNLDEALQAAALHGKLQYADFLITRGASVNAVDQQGRSPLHFAAYKGFSEVCVMLMQKHASINVQCTELGSTPLHNAAVAGHATVCRTLLEFQSNLPSTDAAQVDCRRLDQTTPLHLAAAKGFAEVCEVLLEHHANINAHDARGWQALHYAAEFGHTKICELLLSHRADVNQKTTVGLLQSPLDLAVDFQRVGAARVLLAHHADPNSPRGADNVCCLLNAANSGNLELCELLLDHGAKIDCTDPHVNTPLHNSARKNHVNVCALLLNRGADISARGRLGITPLDAAVFEHATDACRFLLENGADANVQRTDETQLSPLCLASAKGFEDICEILLKHGAFVNQVCGQFTSLCLAAQEAPLAVAQLLLAHGAEVDLAPDGKSPMYLATQAGRIEICELLLQHGANVNVRVDNGCSPLLVAAQQFHFDVCELLLDHGADVNVVGDQSMTPLHWAAYDGRIDLIELFIEHHANLNALAGFNETPVHFAARKGHTSVIERLIAHGADVNIPQKDGVTPLAAAIQNKHAEAASVLRQTQNPLDIVHKCSNIRPDCLSTEEKRAMLALASITEEFSVRELILQYNLLPIIIATLVSSPEVAPEPHHYAALDILIEFYFDEIHHRVLLMELWPPVFLSRGWFNVQNHRLARILYARKLESMSVVSWNLLVSNKLRSVHLPEMIQQRVEQYIHIEVATTQLFFARIVNAVRQYHAEQSTAVQLAENLYDLTMQNPGSRDFQDAGGIPRIIELLKSSKDTDVLKFVTRACWSLSSFLADAEELITFGALPDLLLLLTSEDAAIRQHTAGALADFASHPKLREELLKRGSLESVLAALPTAIGDTQRLFLIFLCNMLRSFGTALPPLIIASNKLPTIAEFFSAYPEYTLQVLTIVCLAGGALPVDQSVIAPLLSQLSETQLPEHAENHHVFLLRIELLFFLALIGTPALLQQLFLQNGELQTVLSVLGQDMEGNIGERAVSSLYNLLLHLKATIAVPMIQSGVILKLITAHSIQVHDVVFDVLQKLCVLDASASSLIVHHGGIELILRTLQEETFGLDSVAVSLKLFAAILVSAESIAKALQLGAVVLIEAFQFCEDPSCRELAVKLLQVLQRGEKGGEGIEEEDDDDDDDDKRM